MISSVPAHTLGIIFGAAGLLLLDAPIKMIREYLRHPLIWRRRNFTRIRQFSAWCLILVLVLGIIGLGITTAISSRVGPIPWACGCTGGIALLMLAVPCSCPKFNTSRPLKALRAGFFITAAAASIAGAVVLP